MEPAPSGDFDNYKHRVLTHPVTDFDALTHVLKSSLGTGILAMPVAFRGSGLILGMFTTIIVSVICCHGAYIVVTSAHELYRRTGSEAMSFGEVAEEACRNGPKWNQIVTPFASKIVSIGIFITYFTTCSCYTVIVAKNFQLVAAYYMGYEPNIRIIISGMLIPVVLLAWVPNLKYLVPASLAANIFMCLGLLLTAYYLVTDVPPVDSRPYVAHITSFPESLAIAVFAMEAIGVVMPIENNMQQPEHFIGIFGVLCQGAAIITVIYTIVGFLGYLKYGDVVEGCVTLNLPKDEILAQSVQILVGLAVLFSFGLQFFVCIDIFWNGIKERFTHRPLIANYIMRTLLSIVCVLLSVGIPTITPFVALIGAIFFSTLGLVVPVYIEVITFWYQGFGRFYWKIWKDIIVILTALTAMIFGTKSAIEDIIELYTKED